MKYVLDSSVAFKWEVTETDSDKAIRLRDESRRGLHEFLAPEREGLVDFLLAVALDFDRECGWVTGKVANIAKIATYPTWPS